jgi:hypothetical protein
MMDYFAEIGLGGVVALFLVREFLNYSATVKKKKCEDDPRYRELEKKIERLYEMHRVTDQDGSPIWYRKTSTEQKIEKIVHAVNNIQQALMALNEALRKISEK